MGLEPVEFQVGFKPLHFVGLGMSPLLPSKPSPGTRGSTSRHCALKKDLRDIKTTRALLKGAAQPRG